MSTWPGGGEVNPFGSLTEHEAIVYGVGSEVIQRNCIVQIFNNLDAQILRQEELWATRDQEYAQLMSYPYRPVVIERIQPQDFHQGSRPSLVEAPANRWPMITVRCNTAAPSASQPDQYDQYDLSLIIEILAKAGPYSAIDSLEHSEQDIIDKRIHRLTDSVIACVRLDPSLGATVLPIQRPPRITPSQVWSKRMTDGSQSGQGPFYLLQGMQLEYTVTRYGY